MKKTDKNYSILLTLFVISIVIANVVGARTITTGIHLGPITLSTSGGAITYAVTFLCTDIVGEIWGRKKAQSMVFFGFVGQIFAPLQSSLQDSAEPLTQLWTAHIRPFWARTGYSSSAVCALTTHPRAGTSLYSTKSVMLTSASTAT